jgi:hypothetical protein
MDQAAMTTRVEAIEEPCAFRILDLPVTEDAALIAQRFEERQRSCRMWENSARPDLRESWKRLMKAGVDLADPACRARLVKLHCDRFRGALGQGVTVYHLSAELAAAVLRSLEIGEEGTACR